jgi:hypothetical protein
MCRNRFGADDFLPIRLRTDLKQSSGKSVQESADHSVRSGSSLQIFDGSGKVDFSAKLV